ncbi:MAG: hypothetical protein ABUS79_04650 [Pseudomonadota bacterium]
MSLLERGPSWSRETRVVARANGASRLHLIVAVVLAVFSGATAACSSDPARPPVGAVGLGLRLAGAANVDRVDFRITGNGIAPIEGIIGVMNSAATVSTFVGGMIPGRDYRIEMTATSTDGRTTCAGAATFDVVINQTTSVGVGLQCRGATDTGGAVVGGGTVNNCPVLTGVVVSPIAVPVGGGIDLGAQASDADARDTLVFHWTGDGGTIARGSSAYTSFTCSVGGRHVLTVTVSDGTCDDSSSVNVNCVPPRCGNSVIEPGEQCDPPGGITCDNSCQRLTICGNAVVERTEECDPPDGITCDSACRRTRLDGGAAGIGGEGGTR